MCFPLCRNGGVCIGHNQCQCPTGYGGRFCMDHKQKAKGEIIITNQIREWKMLFLFISFIHWVECFVQIVQYIISSSQCLFTFPCDLNLHNELWKAAKLCLDALVSTLLALTLQVTSIPSFSELFFALFEMRIFCYDFTQVSLPLGYTTTHRWIFFSSAKLRQKRTLVISQTCFFLHWQKAKDHIQNSLVSNDQDYVKQWYNSC